MDKKVFLQHIEITRDCDPAALDAALNKGFLKAKNNRVDSGKLLQLLAACVFTLVMCFTLYTKPFEPLMDMYYRNWHNMLPGHAEALESYIKDITGVLNNFIGGE